MGKIEKTSGSVSVIGGSDGPTSVFVLSKGKKKTLKQKWQSKCLKRRKKRWERKIKPGTHTMDEVAAYIKEKYGFEEISKDSKEYQKEYTELRTSFIMQYEPELLGEYAKVPELKSHDEEAVKELFAELERRRCLAAEIPEEKFAINLRMFRKTEGENVMHMELESRFEHISGGYSGPKTGKRNWFYKMYRDIYLFYGVTGEDIEKRSKRYETLLTTLAMKNR